MAENHRHEEQISLKRLGQNHRPAQMLTNELSAMAIAPPLPQRPSHWSSGTAYTLPNTSILPKHLIEKESLDRAPVLLGHPFSSGLPMYSDHSLERPKQYSSPRDTPLAENVIDQRTVPKHLQTDSQQNWIPPLAHHITEDHSHPQINDNDKNDNATPRSKRVGLSLFKKKAVHLFGKQGSVKSSTSETNLFNDKLSSTVLTEGDELPILSSLPSSHYYVKTKVGHKSQRRLFRHMLHIQDMSPSLSDLDMVSPSDRLWEFGPTVSLTSASTLAPVWVLRFSRCGRYLASGGQDTVVRVWSVLGLTGNELNNPLPLVSLHLPTRSATHEVLPTSISMSTINTLGPSSIPSVQEDPYRTTAPSAVFAEKPLLEYRGHTADILDICWSKNGFLASSCMDRTVRLWHPSRQEVLCIFQHEDFVVALAFHPWDDRLLLTCSFDSRLRLWSIEDKKLVSWVDLSPHLLTAATFSTDGKLCIIGTYSGACLFYETDGLKYHTQISVDGSPTNGLRPKAGGGGNSNSGAGGNSSTGKNTAIAVGGGTAFNKITSIESWPDISGTDRLLITSNDSRIRMFLLHDKGLERKYKGLINKQMQIRASYSDDGRFVICGSEDGSVYIWRIDVDEYREGSSPEAQHHRVHSSLFSRLGIKRHHSGDYFESFEASPYVTTCALFAPTRTKLMLEAAGLLSSSWRDGQSDQPHNALIVTADYHGKISVFLNMSTPLTNRVSTGQRTPTSELNSASYSQLSSQTEADRGSVHSSNSSVSLEKPCAELRITSPHPIS